jgi:hypothetical protein
MKKPFFRGGFSGGFPTYRVAWLDASQMETRGEISMRERIWITGGRVTALVFLGLAAGVGAWGGTVPAASYTASAWNGSFFGPQVIIHGPGTAAALTGSSTLSTFPQAGLDLTGSVDNLHYFYMGGGNIDYYFEYTGAPGVVPVDIDAKIQVAFVNGANAGGQISIENVDSRCVGPAFGCSNTNFQGTLYEMLSSNTVYHVNLQAEVFANVGNGQGSAHVVVDPVIYLDPGFAGNPNDYTYVQSDGVGNSATAASPEPATFALGGLAVAAMLAMARRRASAN